MYKTYYRFEQNISNPYEFVCNKLSLVGRGVNCFDTKEQAREHFTSAKYQANEKNDAISEGMQKIRKTVGDFNFDYYMNGDTYGIDESGMYISLKVDGYTFCFEL